MINKTLRNTKNDNIIDTNIAITGHNCCIEPETALDIDETISLDKFIIN